MGALLTTLPILYILVNVIVDASPVLIPHLVLLKGVMALREKSSPACTRTLPSWNEPGWEGE